MADVAKLLEREGCSFPSKALVVEWFGDFVVEVA